jgi:hypothetical protein
VSTYALPGWARTQPDDEPAVVPVSDRRVGVEDRRQWNPTDDLTPWIRIVRDAALVVIGVFMLLHETIATKNPNPLVIGAALVTLGLPQVLRLTQGNGDGS